MQRDAATTEQARGTADLQEVFDARPLADLFRYPKHHGAAHKLP